MSPVASRVSPARPRERLRQPIAALSVPEIPALEPLSSGPDYQFDVAALNVRACITETGAGEHIEHSPTELSSGLFP